MTYYKLLTAKNKKLYSHLTNNCRPSVVRYRTGKWTKPKIKNSCLYVFSSLEALFKFWPMVRKSSYARVYECEVKNPKYNPIMTWNHYNLIDFWKYPCFNRIPPTGTIGCDAVKITKRVDIKNYKMYKSYY